MVFIHIFLFIACTVYITEDSLLNKWFVNYKDLYNGYDITSVILIFISLLVPTISTKFGRKLRYLFILLLAACVCYLSFFSLRYTKHEWVNTSEIVYTYQMLLFISSFSLILNVLTLKHEFSILKGFYINCFLVFGFIIIEIYVLEVFDPKLWELFSYWAQSQIYIIYLHVDIYFMINRRENYYLTSDWFIGFIHLTTDFTFRFWRDIFWKNVLLPEIQLQKEIEIKI